MNEATLQATAAGFSIKGPLTFSTVASLAREGDNLIRAHDREIKIDLGEVSSSDSAGVALLIGWLRMTKAKNVKLIFDSVPKQILQIAAFTNVDELLSFENKQAGVLNEA